MFEKMQEVLADQLGIEQDNIQMESSLKDDLGADSLDMIELIMAMEEEFGIEIADEDAEQIKTVADAVSFIEKHTEN